MAPPIRDGKPSDDPIIMAYYNRDAPFLCIIVRENTAMIRYAKIKERQVEYNNVEPPADVVTGLLQVQGRIGVPILICGDYSANEIAPGEFGVALASTAIRGRVRIKRGANGRMASSTIETLPLMPRAPDAPPAASASDEKN
jgi:hypothetical protein